MRDDRVPMPLCLATDPLALIAAPLIAARLNIFSNPLNLGLGER
ncbi:MAG TPA: hypothetical protein VGL94_05875 [Ktedonobacteraceae bacterium]